MVIAVVVAVVLTRSTGEPESEELFLQAASSRGPDPYTDSTAENSSTIPPTATPSARPSGANGTRSIGGSAPGLYGGTRDSSSCDVERQIDYLASDRAKASAFASVAKIDEDRIPSWLRALTPVQLRADTRVTNHGFRNGEATSYQSVLQSGTAVLVDRRGVPRVRCACGNPLTPPSALEGAPEQRGSAWPGYDRSNVVAVAPASRDIVWFVLFDPSTGGWFERRSGNTGSTDRPTTAPSDDPYETSSPSGDTTPSSPAPDSSPESPGDRSPEQPSSPGQPDESPPPPESPGQPESPGSPGTPQSQGEPDGSAPRAPMS
ncbi:DUF6777 domain-containing protein [Streptomyces sp. NPDC048639]|uniref:DUF6777 domain-containing protein n=1 Tax=Streptomyces sp. NPDC048639 TaxID=3365581 RepID=UPI0037191345